MLSDSHIIEVSVIYATSLKVYGGTSGKRKHNALPDWATGWFLTLAGFEPATSRSKVEVTLTFATCNSFQRTNLIPSKKLSIALRINSATFKPVSLETFCNLSICCSVRWKATLFMGMYYKHTLSCLSRKIVLLPKMVSLTFSSQRGIFYFAGGVNHSFVLPELFFVACRHVIPLSTG